VKSPGLFVEFKQSLKYPLAEEVVDLLFFRPVAFLFVKLFLPLPITPNQVSLIAMGAGITAGFLLAGGDRRHFLLGAACYGLANILDCCDGMIARIKKNGTLTGRIVDGCVDYVIGIAVYGGFAIGLTKAVQSNSIHLPCLAWILVLAAAISFTAHAVFSDKYRNAYINRMRRPEDSDENESRKFQDELQRLEGNKGHTADKILIRIYLRYLQLQSGKSPLKQHRSSGARPQSISSTKVILWNFIGPSTHVFFFVLCACLFNPVLFFIFVIGIANLWMLILFLSAR
jgi:phosphatidylglycerophosphate synthase